MEKNKTFRCRIWETTKTKILGSIYTGLYAVIIALVVTIARFQIFGRSSAMNYFSEFLVDFILAGGLFTIVYFFAYLIFIAPYKVGQGLENERKELEPIKANIEIIIPPNGFKKNDTVTLTVINKNKTADLEKCHARLEFIGSYSVINNEINWFKYDDAQYQKNILWNIHGDDSGEITISADGKDVLNIATITDGGFDFLFHKNETYRMIIRKGRPYNCLVELKLFGHLNGHPIMDFHEFYTIHFEYHPTIKQVQGREMNPEEIAIAWSDQTEEPRFQIRKVEINADTKINEDKGIEIKGNP